MDTNVISSRQAWHRDTIDSPEAWRLRIPERLVTALADRARDNTVAVLDRRLPGELRPLAAEALRPVADALEHGRGFVLLEMPPGWTDQSQVALYWLVGQALGRPLTQNVQGTLLYDVRDTGQDVRYGARFSVTNAESSFHTDNSFGAEVADYVGLLCLRDAHAGGESQLVSGHAVYQELRAHHPEILEVLRQPFHVDRRGGVAPGEPATVRYPVISEANGLLFRYLRYWIEVGHEKAGEPLTMAQVGALDVLDETLNRSDLRVAFHMRPGDVLLINNRWLLHNRTAFTDHEEPHRRRHMVRLWLARA